MKKNYLIIFLVSIFIFIPSVNASASSQFKSYDKRSNNDGNAVDYKYHSKETYEKATGNSLAGNLTTSGINMGVDKALEYGEKYVNNASQKYINNVRKYVSDNMPAQSSYKNFKDYQQAVRNMRQAESSAIRSSQKTAANTGKVLNGAGKAYAAYNLYNDITHLNDESKHRHSSLKQVALTTRYMKVFYGGGAMVNKGLEGAANVSGIANDIVESDEFTNWANEQDNAFLDFADDITDKVNDKAYRDACDLLEWLGINPPNSLPALRTAIKPNIYLYPEEEQDISVIFDSPELLLTVIPDYNSGWYATVSPDGKMIVDGEEYGYLFYESMTGDYMMQKDEGFIVPIQNREEFFKYISNYYGFNEQETNDFVTFWCERLDSDKEYIMYPQHTDIIDVLMAVKINPMPKSIFRIWFLFYENDNITEIRKPKRVIASRDGYTMVEWGGIVAE